MRQNSYGVCVCVVLSVSVGLDVASARQCVARAQHAVSMVLVFKVVIGECVSVVLL